MSNIVPFHFNAHEIRVQVDDTGNPWWVAKDVCQALEYENHRDVLKRLDHDEKGVASIYTPGGARVRRVWPRQRRVTEEVPRHA